MIAFKFLARGSLAPFTGINWPAPSGGAPGAWVTAPAGAPPELWIHACRPRDLPYWTDAELFRVELAGEIRETPFQVRAERARLLERIDTWEPRLASEFILGCALRTRDFALEVCQKSTVDTDGLARATTLDELKAAARSLRAREVSPRAAQLLGYCLDAAISGRTGHAASVSHVAAIAAANLRTSAAGVHDEREWQARWLCERLGIEQGDLSLRVDPP